MQTCDDSIREAARWDFGICPILLGFALAMSIVTLAILNTMSVPPTDSPAPAPNATQIERLADCLTWGNMPSVNIDPCALAQPR